jgi:alkanesulfonate monooxygenase SsuD/methylene tetrahydromethanopterin reductase-like flavin-dependent oxidoreductase (luciferase family)
VAEEKLTQLLAVLRGEPIERDGRVVAVTPAPATPGGPHLSWGGQSPAAARWAARHGLDFVAQSNQDGLEAAYREECERQGRPPGGCMLADPSLPLSTFVARDLDAAWDELGPYLLHDATTYASWNEGDSHTASLSHSDTIEALRAEQGAHRIMTVDEAIDYTRGAGVLALHPLCGGVPPEIAWPYLRRVVDDVMPALTG